MSRKSDHFEIAKWSDLTTLKQCSIYSRSQWQRFPSKINYRIHTDAIKQNLNAVFIEQGMPQSERLVKLNQIAIRQMEVLESGDNRKLLK